MNKLEALNNLNLFYEPLFIEKRQEIYYYICTNKYKLVNEFVDTIKKLCLVVLNMQKYENKNPIAYINCSFLRTSILDKSYFAYINAYDDYWFLDRNESFYKYDLTWLFSHLNILQEQLLKESYKYKPFIKQEDIEKIIMESALNIFLFIEHIARCGFPLVVETNEFKSISISNNLNVFASEYENIGTIVFIDTKILSDKDKIVDLFLSNNEGVYYNKVVKDISISNGNYSKTLIHNSRFINNNISKSNFSESSLYYTDFSKSVMNECDFSKSIISQANFTNCNLSKSNFTDAFGDVDMKRNIPFSIFGVNFQNADLSQVNFTDANLKQANFKGAILSNTDFTNAYLEEAEIEIKYKNKLILTNEQIEQIKWV